MLAALGDAQGNIKISYEHFGVYFWCETIKNHDKILINNALRVDLGNFSRFLIWGKRSFISVTKFAARPEWSSFFLSQNLMLKPNFMGKKAGTEDGKAAQIILIFDTFSWTHFQIFKLNYYLSKNELKYVAEKTGQFNQNQ